MPSGISCREALPYRKGWLDEAMSNYQRAVSMDPGNVEYRRAYNMMQQSGQAYRSNGYSTGADAMDCCTTLMCLNCLCGGGALLMERAKISPPADCSGRSTGRVALVIQLLASLIPSGWTAMAAVAGLAVAVAVSAAGYVAGILCYVVSGVLSLLLLLPNMWQFYLSVCLEFILWSKAFWSG